MHGGVYLEGRYVGWLICTEGVFPSRPAKMAVGAKQFMRWSVSMGLPKKRRSRRLRKKLHGGEFKEMGFEFETELTRPLSPADEDDLLDCFLSEIVEPRSLALGGLITDGFIAYGGRGSVTEDDRESIRTWLSSRPEIGAVRVGKLIDAWHSPEYGNVL